MSKQFKLHLRQETDFFLHCKKVHSPYFSLFYTESEQFQITVVVSKKICKLATQRNAVKRRYTSALQDLLEELRQLKIKVAIVVHEKGISLSVAEIAQHIKINVQKIRI